MGQSESAAAHVNLKKGPEARPPALMGLTEREGSDLEHLLAEGDELRRDLEAVLGNVALVDFELELAAVGDEADACALRALTLGAGDYEDLVVGLGGDERTNLGRLGLAEVDDVGLLETGGGGGLDDLDRPVAYLLVVDDGAELGGERVVTNDGDDEGLTSVLLGPGGVLGELEEVERLELRHLRRSCGANHKGEDHEYQFSHLVRFSDMHVLWFFIQSTVIRKNILVV